MTVRALLPFAPTALAVRAGSRALAVVAVAAAHAIAAAAAAT